MNKAELLEIKKRFKFKDCSFSGFSYIVINNDSPDSDIEVVSDKFLTQADEVQKKYLSIISKAYSSAAGAFANDIEVNGDDKKLLTALSKGEEPDKGLVKTWAAKIKENYEINTAYALIIFSDAYDIPMKDTAKTKIGESDEVYSYIAACICPLKPSSGGIMLTDNGKLKAADVFRMVSSPVLGFIYPSFIDRSSDYDHMYVVAGKEPERQLIRNMYDTDVPLYEKVPKKAEKKEKASENDVVEQQNSYTEFQEDHIRRSINADSTIKQNTGLPVITSMDNMSVNNYDTYLQDDIRNKENNRIDKNISQSLSAQNAKNDITVLPTDHIIERDVNGTKFFMIPETLISYEKLKELIQKESQK